MSVSAQYCWLGEVVSTDIQLVFIQDSVVNDVRRFESRLITLDSSPQRYLTAEKKALIVDSFVKWQVADAGKYYTATGGDEFAATAFWRPALITDCVTSSVSGQCLR